jgi:ribosomal-protein-serine acetyltransferase
MLTCRIDGGAHLALMQQHHAGALASNIERDRARYEEWLSWTAKVTDDASARAFIERFLGKLAAADGLLLGIWSDREMVGGILLRAIDWSARRSEVGFWIGREHEGRGLVTRAAAILMDHAFDELGLSAMALQAATGNKASRAVAERLGFAQEGIVRRAFAYPAGLLDHAVYGLLDDEWRSGAARAKYLPEAA